MSKIGFLIIALTALGLMVLSVWRDRRSARWRSLGLCHQCGAHLGANAKSVPLRFRNPGAGVVRICGGCAKERTIQRWMLASFALVALIALTVWWLLQRS
ncbi:MAG: hypothetical protein A3E00_02455 [Curvibacter sp. RIFCSPHIGHO2_12_FULL_63_18]|uniref:hypothetical protein n=1 Tax=Rhodoferax sp. TaxID=50421 RepID=UPI0008AFC5B2|nr:hypothetical protein [Rhodoferax sp.]OGO96183.1 MAG: hypothetical protein A2037_16380 [Curvibacter sp. GWA2_63_95]OGP06471.1 MAG: hypothetical protein A3E00_02455 [Curvibacter sp. RIFCSPHIGHO2_12_FULL_63_18]HCX81981.1 hypothetical protein [Rhodoferax sp.]